jgi:DNA repair protein RecO (recombination protein O)
LPAFLIGGAAGEWAEIVDGFRLTGHFLERDLLHGRAADILAARERLVERLKRVSS